MNGIAGDAINRNEREKMSETMINTDLTLNRILKYQNKTFYLLYSLVTKKIQMHYFHQFYEELRPKEVR